MTITVYEVYTINKEYNFRDFVFNDNTQNTLEEIYKETTLDLDSSFCLKTFAELEMAKQYLHNKFSEVYDTNDMEISVVYLASVAHEDTENIECNIIEYAKFCDRGIYKLKKYFDTYSGNEKYNIFEDNNKAINLTVEDNYGEIKNEERYNKLKAISKEVI